MYDFGARNYDPAIGRWMNMDPLSENYFILSPYNFVANNPILLSDPDGRRIDFSFEYDDTGHISGMTISVTGKVIDNTNRGLRERKLNSSKEKIIKGINNINVSGSGVKVNFQANIEIANSENDILEDDHVYRLVDDISAIEGVNNIKPGFRPMGYAPVGENVIYLDKHFTSRMAGHETGHSAGLWHIEDSNERTMHPAAYEFYHHMAKNGNISNRQFYRSQALSMTNSSFYTNNDFPGNLMHQDSAKNTRGQSVAGYLITREQVNIILYKFENGHINKGRQR